MTSRRSSPTAARRTSRAASRLEDQGLHRVYAQADDRNVAVHRLLERPGFRCEARLVEADWFEDEWSTLRVDAILRREWELRRGRPR